MHGDILFDMRNMLAPDRMRLSGYRYLAIGRPRDRRYPIHRGAHADAHRRRDWLTPHLGKSVGAAGPTGSSGRRRVNALREPETSNLVLAHTVPATSTFDSIGIDD